MIYNDVYFNEKHLIPLEKLYAACQLISDPSENLLATKLYLVMLALEYERKSGQRDFIMQITNLLELEELNHSYPIWSVLLKGNWNQKSYFLLTQWLEFTCRQILENLNVIDGPKFSGRKPQTGRDWIKPDLLDQPPGKYII